ncbi:MAG: hypothetical protein KGH65_00760 [Candidatus Micrarchaeota archaeon]|nr:hypothetical protein [Candidatus Micrarchaeota archaeon]
MSLSIKYSGSTERKLKGVLKQMVSEAVCIEPRDREAESHATDRVANLVGEVVQLIALCRESESSGKPKRYDVHVYASGKGVEWQYFQVDR